MVSLNLKSLLRKKSDRRYGRGEKETYRKGFNVLVDKNLIMRVKLMAAALETPLYPLVEHLLEIGLYELGQLVEDETARNDLKGHLSKGHLLSDRVRMTGLDKMNSEDFKRIISEIKGGKS